KGLKERQESRQAEAARIHREVLQRKEWTRGLRLSAAELARAQQDLSQETRSLAKEKLAKAQVFARLLDKAADAMERAGERVQGRAQNAGQRNNDDPDGLNVAAETAADEETQRFQGTAVRRLDQLLDALKSDGGRAQRPPQEPGEGGGGGGGGGGGRPGGEDIPQLAQIKALRALQQDVNERTEAFHRKHPDAA